MKKNRIKVIRIATFIIVGVFIGYNVYCLNAKYVANNPLPMPFGYGQAIVLSGSMEPALSVNDLIIYHQKDQYKVGDIIAYQDGNMLVTHRVIDISKGMITTKGDNNNVSDGKIDTEAVIGKAVFIIPHVGGVIRILKNPVVSVSLLIFFFIILELGYRKERRNGEQELDVLKKELKRLQEEKRG